MGIIGAKPPLDVETNTTPKAKERQRSKGYKKSLYRRDFLLLTGRLNDFAVFQILIRLVLNLFRFKF